MNKINAEKTSIKGEYTSSDGDIWLDFRAAQRYLVQTSQTARIEAEVKLNLKDRQKKRKTEYFFLKFFTDFSKILIFGRFFQNHLFSNFFLKNLFRATASEDPVKKSRKNSTTSNPSTRKSSLLRQKSDSDKTKDDKTEDGESS